MRPRGSEYARCKTKDSRKRRLLAHIKNMPHLRSLREMHLRFRPQLRCGVLGEDGPWTTTYRGLKRELAMPARLASRGAKTCRVWELDPASVCKAPHLSFPRVHELMIQRCSTMTLLSSNNAEKASSKLKVDRAAALPGFQPLLLCSRSWASGPRPRGK